MIAARALVVSCAGSGEVMLLGHGPDGRIAVRATVAPGGALMPIARHPHADWLYVARRSDPLAVVRLHVSADRSRLDLIDQSPLPASMPDLAVDASGRWLFAASYPSHLLAILPLSADGRVGPVHQLLATGQHAHAVAPTPDARHLLIPCLGSDCVLAFDFDSDRGQIEPLGAVWQARAGSGPRHLRFNARGDRVYLLHELDATIDVLVFDAARVRLEHVQTVTLPMPEGVGPPWAADLQLTPDGRFLYASERRSSLLHAFAVDPAAGTLRGLGAVPTETQPRGFAIDPGGQALFVVGERSDHLTHYGIGADGTLTALDRVRLGAGPNWVLPIP